MTAWLGDELGSGRIGIWREMVDGLQNAAGCPATIEDIGEVHWRDTDLLGGFAVLPALGAQGVPSGLDSGWTFRC